MPFHLQGITKASITLTRKELFLSPQAARHRRIVPLRTIKLFHLTAKQKGENKINTAANRAVTMMNADEQ